MAADEANEEVARLRALERLRILYTEREVAFDALTAMIRGTLDADFALVTLIDDEYQWIKSGAGTDLRETERSVAFCDHTIRTSSLLEVSDARLDRRFADNPLVTGEPHIRSYLGYPLITAEGYRIGAFCVIGLAPRRHSERDRETVRHAATVVMQMFEMRAELEEARPLSEIVDRRRWEGLLRVDLECGGSPPPVALVEVDDFEDIACVYGTKMADRVLSHVMDFVARLAPPKCRIARLGTAIFGVSLPGLSPMDALHVLETVREAVGDLIVEMGATAAASSTVSIGVVSPWPGESVAALMFRAENVLDQAREKGTDSLVSQMGEGSPLEFATLVQSVQRG